MNQANQPKRPKNYKYMHGIAKVLQPVFNILFYISIFFIVLSLILSVILIFVNVDIDQMLLQPFIKKIENTGIISSKDGPTAVVRGEIKYEISFGNGIKIITDSSNVVLDDIKAVLFAEIFVIICTLLTVAPVFRFLAILLKNISSGELENIIDQNNPRYVMFIGLCVFCGSILIRFIMRFYNYYLAVRFIKCEPQEIILSLGIDFLSGITGLVILFIGLIFAYVFQYIRNKNSGQ